MYKTIRIGASKSAVTVVGVFAGATSLPRGTGEFDRSSGGALSAALSTPGFRGDPGETTPAGARHLLVGLGKADELDADAVRKIGAKLVRRLDRIGAAAVRPALGRAVPRSNPASRTFDQHLAEGMGLANWTVDFFDGTAATGNPPSPGLIVVPDEASSKGELQRGLVLAECTNDARRLAATPPNICNPTWFAAESRRIARRVGLTCRVINATEADKMGMGGLVSVGRGSKSKPCMVVLQHRPARARAGVHVVLVGKTITYDTGGYSLKINNTMKGMKYDKCGGMAVIGAMQAIARLKIPVRVTALLPTAENMVSDVAYRPDDIITMLNGVTVEVTNTDAEGRLVLADALAYACRRVKPTAIVDAATLTGGVVVALGSWSAGLFANDEELAGRVQSAADTTGERVWRLPLWEDHRDFMRSKHADIWNSGPKRDGHPIQGAAFLSFFVDDDVPWAHLDIAGMASVDTPTDLHVVGPTGFGVRLLTQFVEGERRPGGTKTRR